MEHKGSIQDILFYAFMNKKKRLFVPSTQNTFGTLTVKFLMVDSGCNSTLLPIESVESLQGLVKHFPLDDYIWTIANSVGSLRSPVLKIGHKWDKPIEVVFAKDVKPYPFTPIPHVPSVL
eukprot:TRINITY_DN10612_c0_g1_i1.p2 TRINITY_DN10612_c0_g1~~TRINITY_DN10612_c0_g1_i1.p2  ORF type:complete len:120 (+),score=22.63 TRINITY_DN10612_c0_g1_i1:3-362(+)